MTAHKYAEQFKGLPNYYKIAVEAFRAGQKNAKPLNVQKLEDDLKRQRKSLKSYGTHLKTLKNVGSLLQGFNCE